MEKGRFFWLCSNYLLIFTDLTEASIAIFAQETANESHQHAFNSGLGIVLLLAGFGGITDFKGMASVGICLQVGSPQAKANNFPPHGFSFQHRCCFVSFLCMF